MQNYQEIYVILYLSIEIFYSQETVCHTIKLMDAAV